MISGKLFASAIASIDMRKLESISPIIVLASVVTTQELSKEKRTGYQKVDINIKHYLKGSTDYKMITVYIGWKGVKDFDPKLSQGQSVIMFLKSIEKGVGTLAYRGAVAHFPKKHIK